MALPIKKVVLTGGPASGKTTALSILKEEYGPQVETAKEAASLVYGGGLPRDDKSPLRVLHAQRIIYNVTKELESLAEKTNPKAKVILCDRGTLDGAVYWPYGEKNFFEAMKTTIQDECDRYYAVLHMSTPKDEKFYRNSNIRTETFERALEVDAAILKLWSSHPRHIVIPESNDYVKKIIIVKSAVEKIIHGEI
jgi:predicted ATPase